MAGPASALGAQAGERGYGGFGVVVALFDGDYVAIGVVCEHVVGRLFSERAIDELDRTRRPIGFSKDVTDGLVEEGRPG